MGYAVLKHRKAYFLNSLSEQIKEIPILEYNIYCEFESELKNFQIFFFDS